VLFFVTYLIEDFFSFEKNFQQLKLVKKEKQRENFFAFCCSNSFVKVCAQEAIVLKSYSQKLELFYSFLKPNRESIPFKKGNNSKKRFRKVPNHFWTSFSYAVKVFKLLPLQTANKSRELVESR
jgi:hypothetical protein